MSTKQPVGRVYITEDLEEKINELHRAILPFVRYAERVPPRSRARNEKYALIPLKAVDAAKAAWDAYCEAWGGNAA